MKKSIFKVFAFTVLTASFTLTSCKSDNEVISEIQENVPYQLSGVVKGKIILDASKPYTLKESYVVHSGGELVIPAGTKIIANTLGTPAYIAVLQGGKIYIQGTNNNPVIMTSDKIERGEESTGDWGGITICGKASTFKNSNVDSKLGLEYKYGGTDDSDNSGSIKYLVIRGSGARIKNKSNYNGLSLCAVGSATVLENIAVIDGNDDGIECYGGVAKLKNIYLKNNSDDAIDWTEGWSGSMENVYIYQTFLGYHAVIEAEGQNRNPTITNLTAITEVLDTFTGLIFKEESGLTITGLHLSGYKKNVEIEDIYLANVQVEGHDVVKGDNYNAPKVDISTWEWYKK